MNQVSGRPKAGLAPTCLSTGRCAAQRIRGQDKQSRCRNCAKPLAGQSLGSWIQARAPDHTQEQICAIYKKAYPNSNLILPPTLAPSTKTTKAAQKWLRHMLQFGTAEDTFTPKDTPLFHLADFVYCRRHATVPTKLRLANLLEMANFKEAAQLIRAYELSQGQRLVKARQYYNGQVRKYNQSLN